jgi:hypothetical protein
VVLNVQYISWYGFILFFLSGVWYNYLIEDINISILLCDMWDDLNLVEDSSSTEGSTSYAIYNFLKVV